MVVLSASASCAACIRSISSANLCASRASARANSTALSSAVRPLVEMETVDGPPSTDKIGVVPA